MHHKFVSKDKSMKNLRRNYMGYSRVLLYFIICIKDLLSMGFQPNPCDPCVVNKKIDGSQMTITWHVDGLKISHKNPKRIDEDKKN